MKFSFKKIALFITTFLVLSTSSFAFYTDVPSSYEYYDSIKALYDLNRLPDTDTFDPDKNATIVDLYEMTLNYGQIPFSEEVTEMFETAQNLNLIPQSEANQSRSLTITKHYTLSTLFKYLGIGTNYFFDESDFIFLDLSPDSKIAPVAQKAAELGILEDNPAYFKMAKRVTKGEIADYIYKIHKYLSGEIISDYDITTSAPSYYTDAEEDLLENKKFLIFLDIWQNIHQDYLYIDKVTDDELILGAINGLVEKLDDTYTVYHTVDEASSLIDALSGEYEGLGMSLELIDKNITIISPFKDSPSETAGLETNDIIIEVNEESMVGQSVEYCASKIKGPAGTDVKIKILRNGKEKDFTVTREKITYSSLEYEVMKIAEKKVGYIDFRTFSANCYTSFVEAANTLIAKGAEGFIIDLRNNPGGYMIPAIEIFGLFTDEEVTVVQLETEDGDSEIYTSDGNGMLKDYKVVVLINNGSASSSEILSGALHDHGLATLIGETSFGKGSVQQLIEYYDDSIFKYTVAKWLTPNGTDIGENGIKPDKTVENDEDTDWQLDTALEEF